MKRYVVASLLVAALACTDSNAPKVVQPPLGPPSPPPPPAPASFPIQPALDTVTIGSQVQFFAETADSTVDQWVMSDTSIARFGPPVRSYAWVVARAPGTITITARHGADSGLATLVIQEPAAAPAGWDVINLGIMDAIGGRPLAINDSGTIVGALRYNPYASEGQEEQGFIYDYGMMQKMGGPDTVPVMIGPTGRIVATTHLTGGIAQFLLLEPGAFWFALPNGTYSTGSGAKIIGLNARGDILASIGLDGLSTYSTARLWRNYSPVELGQFNESVRMRTLAWAWNTRGQIVGGSPVAEVCDQADCDGVDHPFLWENGEMRDLGLLGHRHCTYKPTLDCSSGVARDINNDGVVVGTTTADSTHARAFIWQNGEMRDLGVFPGDNTTALAINDRGQVLGYAGTDAPGATFLWENGQVQIVMAHSVWKARYPTLGPNGEVIGAMSVVGDNELHAFVWQAGHLTDLGPGEAIAINSRGDIIGTRGALPTLWRRRN